jgi:hypothetical protein
VPAPLSVELRAPLRQQRGMPGTERRESVVAGERSPLMAVGSIGIGATLLFWLPHWAYSWSLGAQLWVSGQAAELRLFEGLS